MKPMKPIKPIHKLWDYLMPILDRQQDMPKLIYDAWMVITCLIVIHEGKDRPLDVKRHADGSHSWSPHRDRGYQAFLAAHNGIYLTSPHLSKALRWLRII